MKKITNHHLKSNNNDNELFLKSNVPNPAIYLMDTMLKMNNEQMSRKKNELEN